MRDKFRPGSDIDLAVISADFGKDRFEKGAMLNLIASKIDCRIEAIPISIHNYLDKETIFPIVDQIQKTGIPLL